MSFLSRTFSFGHRPSFLRRYDVVDAFSQDPRFNYETGGTYREGCIVGYRFTFKGARALAARGRGRRIFNLRDGVYIVSAHKWSEVDNGFLDYYLPVDTAAALLGIAPDEESGWGRWESFRSLLDASSIRVGLYRTPEGKILYSTRDISCLAEYIDSESTRLIAALNANVDALIAGLSDRAKASVSQRAYAHALDSLGRGSRDMLT
jgi:hypothetical protein